MSCDREDQRRKTDEHKRICEHISVCNHRAPPLQEVDNLAVLTGRRIIAQSAALCQFSAPSNGRLLLCFRLTPCFTQNASEALWNLPEDRPSGFALIRKGKGLRPPHPCTPPPLGEFLEAAADVHIQVGIFVVAAAYVEQAAAKAPSTIATD